MKMRGRVCLSTERVDVPEETPIIIEVLDEEDGVPLVFTATDIFRNHTWFVFRTVIMGAGAGKRTPVPCEFSISMN